MARGRRGLHAKAQDRDENGRFRRSGPPAPSRAVHLGSSSRGKRATKVEELDPTSSDEDVDATSGGLGSCTRGKRAPKVEVLDPTSSDEDVDATSGGLGSSSHGKRPLASEVIDLTSSDEDTDHDGQSADADEQSDEEDVQPRAPPPGSRKRALDVPESSKSKKARQSIKAMIHELRRRIHRMRHKLEEIERALLDLELQCGRKK